MASVVEQTPYNEYTADGVATVYPYEFQLLDVDDLVVTVDGVVIPASDFTLSGVGVQAGGSVTFDVAPSNAAYVLLSREIALQRDIEYQNNGDLRSPTVNLDFNRLWQALQGWFARLNSSIRAPYPEQLTVLPGVSERADKTLGFDSAGNPTVLTPVSGSAADVLTQLASSASASLGANLVAYNPVRSYTLGLGSFLNYTFAVTGPESETATTPSNYAYTPGHLYRYGTNTTPGTTDMSAAFEAMLGAMAYYSNPANETAGGDVDVPSGGTGIVPDGTHRVASSVLMPIYTSMVAGRGNRWLKGQAEAGYFGVTIVNDVPAPSGITGPAFKLQAGCSIEGFRFIKQAATQNEAIRINAENARVQYNAFDSALKHVVVTNEIVDIDPIYGVISDNQFFHLNDPDNASIQFFGGTAGGGYIIERNNFNYNAAIGYTGSRCIRYDYVNSSTLNAVKIRDNIFQNVSGTGNHPVVDLTLSKDCHIAGNSWGGIPGASQFCLEIGGSGHLIENNQFAGYGGVHFLSTTRKTYMGPQDFTTGGVTVPWLLDSGAQVDIYDEQGVAWTPTLTFGGAASGMAGTFTGRYTKIRNMVHVYGSVVLTAKGASTGAAVIGGLPHTVLNNDLSYAYAGGVDFAVMTGIGSGITLRGVPNTTTLGLRTSSATNCSDLTHANFNNTSEIKFYATYIAYLP